MTPKVTRHEASWGVEHFKEIFKEHDNIGEILKAISYFLRLVEEGKPCLIQSSVK
jgi:hypothetical protein